MSERLALGTAQFGMDYGVADGRQVPRAQVSQILAFARSNGLDTLDTASAYGDSEEILGRVGLAGWRTVTKLPSIPRDCVDVERWVADAVERSLERLSIPRLHGLLLHKPVDLLGPFGPSLYSGLQQCKSRGFAEKVGISIYDPQELSLIVSEYPIELVQSPYNVFDQRLRSSGWLTRLHAAGIEVHARSAFLQGLLLLPAGRRPLRFSRWGERWRCWEEWLGDNQVTALEACLRFAMAQPEFDRVVVGIDNLEHLREILHAAHKDSAVPPYWLACDDPDLINPSYWNFR